MAVKRFVPLVSSAMLLLLGCGDGEMSLTEYVDRLNAIVGQANQQGEALVASPEGMVLFAEGEQLTGFTPQDLEVAHERVGEIEFEVREATDAIEPPRKRSPISITSYSTPDSNLHARHWRFGQQPRRIGRSFRAPQR